MDLIQQGYEQKGAWGISTSIDLYGCDAEKIRNAKAIENFVVELCDLIKVTRFGECQVVHFGEKEEIAGFSMTQLIETSLVSAHFANQTNTTYLDVFSCKYYNPQIVADFAKKYFEAENYAMNYNLRK